MVASSRTHERTHMAYRTPAHACATRACNISPSAMHTLLWTPMQKSMRFTAKRRKRSRRKHTFFFGGASFFEGADPGSAPGSAPLKNDTPLRKKFAFPRRQFSSSASLVRVCGLFSNASPTHADLDPGQNISVQPRRRSRDASALTDSACLFHSKARNAAPSVHRERDSLSRLERAYTHRLYLLDRRTPTEFDMLGHSGARYRVNLARAPTCTCPDHANRDGGRCKHIFFVLGRVMGVDPDGGPLDDTLLAHLRAAQISGWAPTLGDVRDACAPSAVAQRLPEPGDPCPICFEDLVGEACAFCATGCGGTIHALCITRWSEAKRASAHPVTCPLCRHEGRFERA